VGAMQRTKGAAGERELIKLLAQDLGLDLERNLDQVRCGGADILGVDGWIIEVKRCEVLAKDMWWKQVQKAALKYPHKTPAVAYRRSRQSWVFMLPFSLLVPGAEPADFLEVSYGRFIKLARRR
jgi:hypothetical protein